MLACVAAALFLAAPGRGQDYDKALLRVFVPDNAKLEIQGHASKKTGEVRLFESPLLPPGKPFLYDLKATWTENGKTITREKTVRVMAGQTTEVDLRVEDKPILLNPGPVKPPEPKPVDKPGLLKPPDPKPADPKPAAAKPVKLDVPYVKTPDVIVDEMLKMAKVKDGDVVYDLGCGDGRIVIRAVKQFKAKAGVGIDIDPDRVKESEAAAKAAGVSEKTTFKVGDVLKLTDKDLAGATVVTMYLYPKINDQLAPVLKKLPKGTRIVSHDFKITDWAPDDSIEAIEVEGIDHSVYMWVIK
jgi:uncharacterized protein (TIGR03000 family)